jgi:hypothetical protein
MTSDSGEPNYQAATDPTGTKYVAADATNLTDLYKWQLPPVDDIKAVVMRGASTRYQNVQASYKTPTGSITQFKKNVSNPSEYLSVCENDGTDQWTTASIQAAEFGQTSK